MNYGKVFGNFKVQIVLLAIALSFFALFLSDANPYTFDAKLGLEFVGVGVVPG